MFENLLSSGSDPGEKLVVIVTLLSLRFCPILPSYPRPHVRVRVRHGEVATRACERW
jgi:hypothetical protein